MRPLPILVGTLLMAVSPAFAAVPPDDGHWSLEPSRDGGGWTATSDNVAWSWRVTERGATEFGALSVGGHETIAALRLPYDLGMPEARGAKLAFAHPPEPVHLALWDNPTGRVTIGCVGAVPPDDSLGDDACSLTFPAGHALTLVNSREGHHELRVDMEDARGIVPCVRIAVDGDVAVNGLTLAFVGQLRLSVPPEPVTPAA